MPGLKLSQRGSFQVGVFVCMASPCEVQVEIASAKQAAELIRLALCEAQRIEKAFSRYRDDNQVSVINNSAGATVRVNDEMARMLDFADVCYQMSDGLFDVTSGVLGKAWRFDGSDRLPADEQIKALLKNVGWNKVQWQKPFLTMPAGMQIDLGGIGKEYAVDRTVSLLNAEAADVPFLVNYGGDLHANMAPKNKPAWSVGIEAARHDGRRTLTLQLHRGALATSGDARRYLLKDGIRYGHVLNPLTGWPVRDAPAAITVAADSCIQAGILSTLALLKGANAEQFLEQQGVSFWCQR